jgi:anti-anti-sigma factor
MSNQVEIKVGNGALQLFGDLDFNNVMSLYQKSIKLFSSQSAILTLDFAGLRSTNSVALALIVNWMRLAEQTQKSIKLLNLSPEVMSLAKASGLDKVIEPIIV